MWNHHHHQSINQCLRTIQSAGNQPVFLEDVNAVKCRKLKLMIFNESPDPFDCCGANFNSTTFMIPTPPPSIAKKGSWRYTMAFWKFIRHKPRS